MSKPSKWQKLVFGVLVAASVIVLAYGYFRLSPYFYLQRPLGGYSRTIEGDRFIHHRISSPRTLFSQFDQCEGRVMDLQFNSVSWDLSTDKRYDNPVHIAPDGRSWTWAPMWIAWVAIHGLFLTMLRIRWKYAEKADNIMKTC